MLGPGPAPGSPPMAPGVLGPSQLPAQGPPPRSHRGSHGGLRPLACSILALGLCFEVQQSLHCPREVVTAGQGEEVLGRPPGRGGSQLCFSD